MNTVPKSTIILLAGLALLLTASCSHQGEISKPRPKIKSSIHPCIDFHSNFVIKSNAELTKAKDPRKLYVATVTGDVECHSASRHTSAAVALNDAIESCQKSGSSQCSKPLADEASDQTESINSFMSRNSTYSGGSSSYLSPTFLTNKKEAEPSSSLRTSARSPAATKPEVNPWDETGRLLGEAVNQRNKRKRNSARRAGNLKQAEKYEKRIVDYERSKNQLMKVNQPGSSEIGRGSSSSAFYYVKGSQCAPGYEAPRHCLKYQTNDKSNGVNISNVCSKEILIYWCFDVPTGSDSCSFGGGGVAQIGPNSTMYQTTSKQTTSGIIQLRDKLRYYGCYKKPS